MQCQIIAVGQKMPEWCILASQEYLKRLQRFFKCSLLEIATAPRHKSANPSEYKQREGEKILQKIAPHDFVIGLDVVGQVYSTEEVANELKDWQQVGQKIIFMIGGPDGLATSCLTRANARWSLSALTFPHPLARVVLLEQLYRAATILVNHPYHRE